jgi:hypothetical protein
VAKNVVPVFIGGTGRSGTTIALNLLKDHSEFHASLPREIKFLTTRSGALDLIFGRPFALEETLQGIRNNCGVRVLQVLGKDQRSIFEKRLFGPWWSEMGKAGKPRGLVQAIDIETLTTIHQGFDSAFKDDPIVATREFFFALAHAQIKKPGARLFGDSTPVNMMNAARLHAVFPEAKFVNMVRDGRDVALSVAKEKWGPSDPYKGLTWWANRIQKASSALAGVPREKQLTMRLENLAVNSREGTYLRYLEFLGISDEKAMREYFDTQVSPEKLHEGRWKSEVSNPKRFDAKYKKILEMLASRGISVEELA